MRVTRYILTAIFYLILCQVSLPAFSQVGISFNLKKPKEYDDRELRSERSDQKKFTPVRRLIQNTVTHYNYFFNANNKLNEVLERAKSSFKDDYSQLLPFYNYTLDATQADSIQLDSITYKSSTAIALHDLRNDWADNMYLLWGASYYLQKKFDSAYLMFQFINYAFAPKEKDGYYITIGSARDGNAAYSIATKEKNSLPRRIFSEPPSRNDAFIWQIRNFLAQDQMAEASSLMVTLRNDPAFPKRLQNDLDEVLAFYFYKQEMWDSSATHLVKALGNATNADEKARWEYLAAQMFELAGNYKEAEDYYDKVSKHTTDPVLDIYARLYSIRVNKDGGDKSIEKNVAELLKMAKKDRFEDYQDIIYYMAAQMQLQGNHVDEAMSLLQKSTKYSSNNPAQRNRAFLQLAELAYNRTQYPEASKFYDSIRLDDPTLKDPDGIKAKQATLKKLAVNFEIAARQDSLQRLAAMPEDQRKDFIKKLVRDLRKQQGLKDEGVAAGPAFVAPTLFPSVQPKGEWYFYNDAFRSKGLADFKAKWGNRANVDNWRRQAAVNSGIQNSQQIISSNQQAGAQGSGSLTYEDMLANVPLTPEQLQSSNDSLQAALFSMGKIYIQEIEDCKAGTTTFEQLRTKFPDFANMSEVLFNLYYCYNKNGETAKADAIKKLMAEKYGNSNFTTIVTTGKDPLSPSNEEATKAYEKVYDLFIEGQFEQAVADKKTADARYGKYYWTPQLLYIEAVYYIKQRNDSTAKNILNNIVSQFPKTPLAAKATNLIDVLNRRAEIEEELRNLVVTRDKDDAPVKTVPVVSPPVNKPVVTDSAKVQPPVVVQPPVNKPPVDSVKTKPVVTNYTFNASNPHYVVLVLNKVDPVFVNEAKNAFLRYNRDTYYNKQMTADLFELDPENRLLLISPFRDAPEATDYVDKTRPKTATEILPWLRGGKYSYIILDEANFNVLKNTKDVEAYRSFLNQHIPGKF